MNYVALDDKGFVDFRANDNASRANDAHDHQFFLMNSENKGENENHSK